MSTDERETPPGIPVDGRFWTTDDLTHAQYLEVRDLVRRSTGDRSITYLDDPQVSESDLLPAIVFVVRRDETDGGNKDYTYADALKLRPSDHEQMREEALAALPPEQAGNGPARATTPSAPSPPSSE